MLLASRRSSHSSDTSLKVALYSVVLRRSSRFDNGEYPLGFALYFTILERGIYILITDFGLRTRKSIYCI